MYTLYKFHFLNGISEINQLFDDILIIWPAPVYMKISKEPAANPSFRFFCKIFHDWLNSSIRIKKWKHVLK